MVKCWCAFLTLNYELQWKAVCFDLSPVHHHAAYVFAVVFWSGNHAVVAANRHSVVRAYLRHRRRISICRGHPVDLGSGAAVRRLTKCHHDRLSACFHRYDGGRVLRLS